jgi:hypothetical protein
MSPDGEAFTRSIALVQELESQSDRGAAIVGAAWVEEELTAAIRSFLQKDKRAWERLFNRSAPLSAFASKIDLARLLGMCTAAIASDLHIVRELRNEFAHSVLSKDHIALAFSLPHLKDKCMALRCVAHEELSKPRTAFVRACAVLNSDFYIHRFSGRTIEGGETIFAKVEHGV